MKMTLIEGFSSGLIGAVIAIFVSYMEDPDDFPCGRS